MPPTSPPNKTTSNTPADIDAGLTQTFVFAITPTAPIAPTDVQLTFDCSNTDPAPIFAGAAVNTLLFSASTGPIPDIIGTGMGAIRWERGSTAFYDDADFLSRGTTVQQTRMRASR